MATPRRPLAALRGWAWASKEGLVEIADAIRYAADRYATTVESLTEAVEDVAKELVDIGGAIEEINETIEARAKTSAG
jgi:methyl-accepting chemotaxis protein